MAVPHDEDGFRFAEVDVPAGIKTCEDIVRFLLEQLVRNRQLSLQSVEPIFDQVMRRESLGSTAIGRRAAIPHAKTELVEMVLGIIGSCSEPVVWDSTPCGQDLETICLLITPTSLPGDGLRALESVSRRLWRNN